MANKCLSVYCWQLISYLFSPIAIHLQWLGYFCIGKLKFPWNILKNNMCVCVDLSVCEIECMLVEAELLCTDFSKLFDVALLAYSEGRKCYGWINKHTHKVMSKLSSQPVVNIWFSSLVFVDISLCISRFWNCFPSFSNTFKTQSFRMRWDEVCNEPIKTCLIQFTKLCFSGALLSECVPVSWTCIALVLQTF